MECWYWISVYKLVQIRGKRYSWNEHAAKKFFVLTQLLSKWVSEVIFWEAEKEPSSIGPFFLNWISWLFNKAEAVRGKRTVFRQRKFSLHNFVFEWGKNTVLQGTRTWMRSLVDYEERRSSDAEDVGTIGAFW